MRVNLSVAVVVMDGGARMNKVGHDQARWGKITNREVT